MATAAQGQVTVVDLTDAYSVILTSESYTFLGTTSAVKETQATTTQVIAMCGSEQVPCKVGTIKTPNGLAAVSDGKSPAPTITFTATTALTSGGSVTIPITVGDGITINKVFSYSIAFTGATGAKGETGAAGKGITSITNHYLATEDGSGVTTETDGWTDTVQSITSSKKYLWNYETVTYTDKTKTDTDPHIIGVYGTTGATGTAGKGITSIVEYYALSTNTTAPTDSAFSKTVPTMSSTNKYLWNYEEITYTDGNTEKTDKRIVGAYGNTGPKGEKGANGDDAITLVITSSNGIIFKNTAIATTLTAHVYKGGQEMIGSAIAQLGTIKWYKDGGAESIATGQTLTIAAGDVTNRATYTAQLEG